MQSQENIRSEQPAWREGVSPVGAEGLANKGPFYCYTVGTPVFIPYSSWVRVFEEQPDGSKRLAETLMPGVLYSIHEDAILIDVEVANGKGNNTYRRQAGGTEETVTDVPTSPGDNVRYLTQTHGESGLRFIPAFEGRDRRVIQPRLFTTLLRPLVLMPEYLEENPEVAKAVRADGALAVYEKMFQEGSKYIKSAAFAEKYSAELQKLYIAALPAVADCYRAVRAEAARFLNAEDARVRQGAAKGAHYDSTGGYYQYLLARTGVDEALSRALQPQTIVIEDQRQQAETTPLPAMIWCETCGAYSNLGPQGQKPKLCSGCKEPFEQSTVDPVKDYVDAGGKVVAGPNKGKKRS